MNLMFLLLFFLQEITKFATYVIRQFVEVAEKNKKVFMEMLFWKGHREASEIVDGYGSYQGYSCNLTFSTMFLEAKENLLFCEAQSPYFINAAASFNLLPFKKGK